MLDEEKDKMEIEEIHQLNVLAEDNKTRKNIFPITVIQAIYDAQHGHRLDSILGNINCIYVPYAGTDIDTKLLVPIINRRKGLLLTYVDYDNNIWCSQYNGDLTSDEEWVKEDNWKEFSVFPDEEDITIRNGKISFKDKEYKPEEFSGLGRVILRRNIVGDTCVYDNLLTQDMFTQSNTIYEIRYDFDLDGKEIYLPANCTLYFNGGKLDNGILYGDSAKIDSALNYIFGNNIVIRGSWDVPGWYPEWFGSNEARWCNNIFERISLFATDSNNYAIKNVWLTKLYPCTGYLNISGRLNLIGIGSNAGFTGEDCIVCPQFDKQTISNLSLGELRVSGDAEIYNCTIANLYLIATGRTINVTDSIITNITGHKNYPLSNVTIINNKITGSITFDTLNLGNISNNNFTGKGNSLINISTLSKTIISGNIFTGIDDNTHPIINIATPNNLIISNNIVDNPNKWNKAEYGTTNASNNVKVENNNCNLFDCQVTGEPNTVNKNTGDIYVQSGKDTDQLLGQQVFTYVNGERVQLNNLKIIRSQILKNNGRKPYSNGIYQYDCAIYIDSTSHFNIAECDEKLFTNNSILWNFFVELEPNKAHQILYSATTNSYYCRHLTVINLDLTWSEWTTFDGFSGDKYIINNLDTGPYKEGCHFVISKDIEPKGTIVLPENSTIEFIGDATINSQYYIMLSNTRILPIGCDLSKHFTDVSKITGTFATGQILTENGKFKLWSGSKWIYISEDVDAELARLRGVDEEFNTRITNNTNSINTINNRIIEITSELNSINGNINTINELISDLQQTDIDLSGDISELNTKLNTTNTNITNISNELDELEIEFNNFINTTNSTLNSYIDLINTNKTNISNLSSSISNLNTSITNIENNITTLQEKITNIENNTGQSCNCDLTSILNDIASLKSSVAALQTLVNNHITRIDEIVAKNAIQDDRLTALENRVLALENNSGDSGGEEDPEVPDTPTGETQTLVVYVRDVYGMIYDSAKVTVNGTELPFNIGLTGHRGTINTPTNGQATVVIEDRNGVNLYTKTHTVTSDTFSISIDKQFARDIIDEYKVNGNGTDIKLLFRGNVYLCINTYNIDTNIYVINDRVGELVEYTFNSDEVINLSMLVNELNFNPSLWNPVTIGGDVHKIRIDPTERTNDGRLISTIGAIWSIGKAERAPFSCENAIYLHYIDPNIASLFTSSMDSAYYKNCNNIRSIVWPTNPNYVPFSIDFENCYEWCEEEVTIPEEVYIIAIGGLINNKVGKFILPSTISGPIQQMTFYGCANLKSVDSTKCANSITNINESAFEGCVNLKLILTTFAPNLESIGDRAFAGCESLTTFVIPNTVTSIGTEVIDGAGTNLQSIRLPNNTSYTAIEENTFYSSKSISVENVYIPNNITNIKANNFHRIYCVNTFELEKSNDAINLNMVTIDGGSFSPFYHLLLNCNTVKLNRPINYNPLVAENYLLYGCVINNLYVVGVSDWSGTIGRYANKITNMQVTDCAIENMAEYAFHNVNMELVIFSGCSGTSVSTHAFSYNNFISGTSPIVLPDVGELMDYAFYCETPINEIIIPETITSLGDHAIPEVTDVVNAMGTNPPIIASSLFGNPEVIYIPQGTLTLYQGASGWAEYQDIMVER